jgi:hypothetical protein
MDMLALLWSEAHAAQQRLRDTFIESGPESTSLPESVECERVQIPLATKAKFKHWPEAVMRTLKSVILRRGVS